MWCAAPSARCTSCGGGGTEVRWRWHTLLFAVYPVLFLYARNSGNLPGEVLVRPLLMAVGLAIVALLLARAVAGEWNRGALLATAWVVLWSTYGHAHQYLSGGGGAAAWFGHHRILLPLWIALVLWLTVTVRRGRPRGELVRDLHRAATLIGLVLVGLAGVSSEAGLRAWQSHLPKADHRSPRSRSTMTHPDADIYHIVLDGYARADILRDLYDYDNAPFLEALRTRGFCVADSARSNFAQTLLSVTSALWGNYPQTFGYTRDDRGQGRRVMSRELRRAMDRSRLSYHAEWTRAFATGYTATDMLWVDRYLGPVVSLNEFERALVAATPIDVLLNLLESRYGDVLHRRRVEYAFAHLPVAPTDPPRAFTFAHIVAPHPPFVFAPPGATAGAMVPLADGDHVIGESGLTVAQYRAAYRAQVEAVNMRILAAIDAILGNGRESAILLHGDHGPGSLLRWEESPPDPTAARERFGILLALRLPGEDADPCYPSMSPVNASRRVSGWLTGLRVDELPDRAYFSTWSRPYDFVEIAPDGRPVAP